MKKYKNIYEESKKYVFKPKEKQKTYKEKYEILLKKYENIQDELIRLKIELNKKEDKDEYSGS